MALDDAVVRLAKGRNLATVVTLMPDGQPQAQLTWIDTDGDNVLVNTAPSRQRVRNVARDPRITVLIHSADNPWEWAEVRGRVTDTITGDEAVAQLHGLANRYIGSDYRNPIGPEGRVVLVVTPEKVNVSVR